MTDKTCNLRGHSMYCSDSHVSRRHGR